MLSRTKPKRPPGALDSSHSDAPRLKRSNMRYEDLLIAIREKRPLLAKSVKPTPAKIFPSRSLLETPCSSLKGTASSRKAFRTDSRVSTDTVASSPPAAASHEIGVEAASASVLRQLLNLSVEFELPKQHYYSSRPNLARLAASIPPPAPKVAGEPEKNSPDKFGTSTASNSKKKRGNACYICGQTGHWRTSCWFFAVPGEVPQTWVLPNMSPENLTKFSEENHPSLPKDAIALISGMKRPNLRRPDPPKVNIPKSDNRKRNTSENDAPRQDPPKSDTPKRGVSNKEAPNSEIPMKQNPKLKIQNAEILKPGVPKPSRSNRRTRWRKNPKPDPPGSGITKPDTPKSDDIPKPNGYRGKGRRTYPKK